MGCPDACQFANKDRDTVIISASINERYWDSVVIIEVGTNGEYLNFLVSPLIGSNKT